MVPVDPIPGRVHIHCDRQWTLPFVDGQFHQNCFSVFWDATVDALEIIMIGETHECGVWLAPSTLPGSGLGMFAGRNFEKGEALMAGDVVIPIVDLEAHWFGKSNKFLWNEYLWEASSFRCDGDGVWKVDAASPGFSAAANSFPPIANVDSRTSNYDAAGVHRRKDPGAGAFSYISNRTSIASRSITVGDELFVDYGDKWFHSRMSSLGPLPLHDDLHLATKLYKAFHELEERLGDYPGVSDLLWEEFMQKSFFNESRVLGGFHFQNPHERTLLANNKTLEEIRIEESRRSIEWLEVNGNCADHLTVKRSTIHQAGHGAFASRALPKDSVVAQLPLIHIQDRKLLDMHKIGDKGGKPLPSKKLGLLGKQLLINYCFGHSSSTILLCPYGPVVRLESIRGRPVPSTNLLLF